MAKNSKQKEVAKHPPMGSREESFGSAPGQIAIGGGTMHKFGYKAGNPNKVWPDAPVSVDQKTGYPEGFQSKTKTKGGPS